MKIAFNESNGLFQLVEAPKPKKLFNENYAFMSSTSKSMQIHFKGIARKIMKMMNKNSRIMEIGCNDGIFLENFKTSVFVSNGINTKFVQDVFVTAQ